MFHVAWGKQYFILHNKASQFTIDIANNTIYMLLPREILVNDIICFLKLKFDPNQQM